MKVCSICSICSAVALGIGMVLFWGCGDDDPPPPPPGPAENTGQSCAAPSQCYDYLDGATLQGAVVCMDRVEGGYCTHECETDSDCCAVPGECRTNLKQVCSPFESAGKKYCFLSCEKEDWQSSPTPYDDDTDYCQTNAHVAFGCRSSGGGSENRKVCTP